MGKEITEEKNVRVLVGNDYTSEELIPMRRLKNNSSLI